MLLKREIKEIF